MVADYRTRLIGSLAFQCRPFGRHFFFLAPGIKPRPSFVAQARCHSTTPDSKPVPKATQHCIPGTPPSALPKAPAALPGPLCSHAGPRFIPLRRSRLSWEPKKQKNALNCNFFAIRDCCGAPKRVSRRKSTANRLIGSPFVLCTDKKRVRNRKKVAQTPDYLFSQREDRHNGADPEKGYRQKSENPSGRRRERKGSRTSSDGHWAQVQRSCKWRKTGGAAGGSNGTGHTPANQQEPFR